MQNWLAESLKGLSEKRYTAHDFLWQNNLISTARIGPYVPHQDERINTGRGVKSALAG